MKSDAEAAGRLAADRHFMRIAAKSRDMFFHPFERELLVH
jgi:hypothetical protein